MAGFFTRIRSMAVKIYKAMVIVGGDVCLMDVIEYAGGFWLVPKWLDYPAQKVTKPVRIVSLATLPHQRGRASPEFVVDGPVPKYVFDGRVPSSEAGKYIVVEAPDILIQRDPRLH
jgi:hypothetical protein